MVWERLESESPDEEVFVIVDINMAAKLEIGVKFFSIIAVKKLSHNEALTMRASPLFICSFAHI